MCVFILEMHSRPTRSLSFHLILHNRTYPSFKLRQRTKLRHSTWSLKDIPCAAPKIKPFWIKQDTHHLIGTRLMSLKVKVKNRVLRKSAWWAEKKKGVQGQAEALVNKRSLSCPSWFIMPLVMWEVRILQIKKRHTSNRGKTTMSGLKKICKICLLK